MPSEPPVIVTSLAMQCSFCGKHAEGVEKLIAGLNGVYICDQCVDLYAAIVAKHRAATGNEPSGE